MSDPVLAIIFTALSGLILGLAAFGRFSGPKTPASTRAVIAQYTPPSGVSVLEGAIVLNSRRRSISAQIVDLTVRGALRVLEPDAAGAVHRLELVDPRRLEGDVERAVVEAIFGRTAKPGSITRVNARNAPLARRLRIAQARAEGVVSRARLLARQRKGWRPFLPFAQLLVVIPAMVWGSGLPLLPLHVLVFGLATLVLTFGRYHVLTPTGVELRDHLLGLRAYIRLAEADRMRTLQAPDTALTRGEELVLTERLLGWAVLFGYGREWARLLAMKQEEAGVASSDTSYLVGFSAAFEGVAPTGVDGDLASDPVATSDSDGSAGEGASGGFDFASSSSGGGDSGGGDSGGDGGGGGGGD